MLFIQTLLAYTTGTATEPSGVITSISERFERFTLPWATEMQFAGVGIFVIFSGIAFIQTCINASKRNATMSGVMKELGYFFAWNSVHLMLLTQSPEISTAILDTLTEAATRATGNKFNLASNPSAIVDLGYEIFAKYISSLELSLHAIITDLLGAFFLIVAVFGTFVIGLNHLEIQCQSWILIYGGMIVLGFGAYSETRDIAKNYYKCILAIGCQQMGVIFTMSIGKAFLDFWIADIHDFGNGNELLGLALAVGAILYIGCGIPAMFAKMVMGSGPVGNNSMGGVLSSMIGLGAATGAVIATGGAAISAIGAELAGAATAVNAAKEAGASSSSTGSTQGGHTGPSASHGSPSNAAGGISMGPTGWSDLGDTSQTTGEQAAESFANTYGHGGPAEQPGDTATDNDLSSNDRGDRSEGRAQIGHNLRQGLKDHAAQKLAIRKAQFRRRVDKTTGGQVAKHILKKKEKL